ncbi:MAG: hypothetical protein CMQ40_00420 [Gammaproteobacteria bacterium]|nr:hypothetical protein [Gammaproteobacteria bacterium]
MFAVIWSSFAGTERSSEFSEGVGRIRSCLQGRKFAGILPEPAKSGGNFPCWIKNMFSVWNLKLFF